MEGREDGWSRVARASLPAVCDLATRRVACYDSRGLTEAGEWVERMNYYYLFMGLLFVAIILWVVIAVDDDTTNGGK